jgi:hypothetical protein
MQAGIRPEFTAEGEPLDDNLIATLSGRVYGMLNPPFRSSFFFSLEFDFFVFLINHCTHTQSIFKSLLYNLS